MHRPTAWHLNSSQAQQLKTLAARGFNSSAIQQFISLAAPYSNRPTLQEVSSLAAYWLSSSAARKLNISIE